MAKDHVNLEYEKAKQKAGEASRIGRTAESARVSTTPSPDRPGAVSPAGDAPVGADLVGDGAFETSVKQDREAETGRMRRGIP